MPNDVEGPSPPDNAQLPRDRCPNCGRPLEFPEGEAQGLCTACGIYVEILTPLPRELPSPPASRADDIAKRRESALFHLNLYDMLDPSEDEQLEAPKDAEATPAPQTAPTTTPLREELRDEKTSSVASVVPEQGPRLRLEPTHKVAPPPTKPPLVAAKIMRANKAALIDLARAHGLVTDGTKAQLRDRLMEERDRLKSDKAVTRREAERSAGETVEWAQEGRAATQTAKIEAAPSLPVVAQEVAKPKDQVQASPPSTTGPSAEGARGEAAPSLEEKPSPADSTVGTGPQPSAQASDTEPPLAELEWDEWTLEEEVPVLAPPQSGLRIAPEAPGASDAEQAADEALDVALATSQARLRRDRATFYIGVVCAAVGGIGLGLGSLLHDFFRVPMVGRAYGAFGSLNVVATLLGGLVALIGFVAIGLSLRGGVIRPAAVARA